eukprot:293585-Hanusia_phi.AAC.1
MEEEQVRVRDCRKRPLSPDTSFVCFSTVTRKTRSRRTISERSNSEATPREVPREGGGKQESSGRAISHEGAHPRSLFYRRSRRELNDSVAIERQSLNEPKFRVINLAEPQEALKAAVKFGGSRVLDSSTLTTPRMEVSHMERERPSSTPAAHTPKRLSSTPRVASLRDGLSPRRAALPFLSLSPRQEETVGEAARWNHPADSSHEHLRLRASSPLTVQTSPADRSRALVTESALNSPSVVDNKENKSPRPSSELFFSLEGLLIPCLLDKEVLKRGAGGLTPVPSGLTPLRKKRAITANVNNWLSPNLKRKFDGQSLSDARKAYKTERAVATAMRDHRMYSAAPDSQLLPVPKIESASKSFQTTSSITSNATGGPMHGSTSTSSASNFSAGNSDVTKGSSNSYNTATGENPLIDAPTAFGLKSTGGTNMCK